MTQPSGEVKRYSMPDGDYDNTMVPDQLFGSYILHSDHVAELERVRRETVEKCARAVEADDGNTGDWYAARIRGMAGADKIQS